MKIRDLAEEVEIHDGFPGKYIYTGGTSYYLNGDAMDGEIHFTVNGNDDDNFEAFHLTRSIDGSNVGIWYQKGAFSNVNKKNLPGFKVAEWEKWWSNNRINCDYAAMDFWNQLTS